DERDASRTALLQDIDRLETQREEAENRVSALETQAMALRQGIGDAESLARDAAAERDRCVKRAKAAESERGDAVVRLRTAMEELAGLKGRLSHTESLQ
ncbi:unnamed protein product, partial [Ectocarpus sp. 8 AP-2014]